MSSLVTEPEPEHATPPLSTRTPASRKKAAVSGRLVVLGMFGFGLVLSLGLYVYWDLHTRTFRPLQQAIAGQLPGSSPRVVGGRYKSHQANRPLTLRLIIQVPYNPVDDSSEDQRQKDLRTVYDLARSQLDVGTYELVEVHLEHRNAEQEPDIWTVRQPPDVWESGKPLAGLSLMNESVGL